MKSFFRQTLGSIPEATKQRVREYIAKLKIMNSYLAFFRLNGSLEVRRVNASDIITAESTIANLWGNRLHATSDKDLQDVKVLYIVPEPEDWTKKYVVQLEGEFYSVDYNYHLVHLETWVMQGEYIEL